MAHFCAYTRQSKCKVSRITKKISHDTRETTQRLSQTRWHTTQKLTQLRRLCNALLVLIVQHEVQIHQIVIVQFHKVRRDTHVAVGALVNVPKQLVDRFGGEARHGRGTSHRKCLAGTFQIRVLKQK